MFENVVAKLQKVGAVGVLPTDTVYGLVARASDKTAVERLYKLKSRQSKPGTVIAASIDQLVELGLKRRYLKAVEQFWPGPVSVVVPISNPQLTYLHQNKMSLAVRLPKAKDLNKLLMQTGPLLTSSANKPDHPVANTLSQAKDYFGDQVDFYVDGGDLSNSAPSTIIRILDDAIEVLRQGAVKIGDDTISP
jgi:L-threonylcarbamoyladenylate synthase